MKNEVLSALEVHHWPFGKKRLGKINDGGYVVCMIPDITYDLFLSGGIDKDVSFEEDFLSMYPGIPSYAFDHSIEKLPEKVRGIDAAHSKKINFIKKKIGKLETTEETNLIDYLNNYQNVFLKLDIEKGEYDLWEALTNNLLNNIAQFVVEVHPTHLNKFKNFILKAHETHEIFHAHCNNGICPIKHAYKIEDISIPGLLELTYVRKNILKFSLENNTNILPSVLDSPNCSSREDVMLNYYPFISK